MLLRWLVIIPAAAAPVFDPADGSGARKRPNSRRRARLGACASDVRSSHCVGDMRSRRGADEPSLWATGCQRSTILWPRGARSQVLQSALAKLHPVTVVLTCLLDHPVGAQCMQTGYNAHSAGRTALLQRARMPESDYGSPHGVQAPVSTALRADKLQRTDRNGRRRRSQGSSHRRRESKHYVDRHPHRPDSCCAQCADAHSVRHGRSGSRATTLPMRLFAHCLTRPSPCRSLARWTMWMRQKPVGSPPRWAVSPHMTARRQGSR
jgi:hypothetical protein